VAKCLWCGRHGPFLKTTDVGLCLECHTNLQSEILPRIEKIEIATRGIKKTQDYQKIIEFCDEIIFNSRELMKYHDKGIPLANQTPPELISTYSSIRDQAYREMIEDEKGRDNGGGT